VIAIGNIGCATQIERRALATGAHLVALQREDSASRLRPQIAIKAAGALGRGVSSRKIAEMAADRPTFIGSLASLAGQGMVPAAGGILGVVEGRLVGALGLTGDASDRNEACALAGL
jgi:uncharacterized protein GlcG (DUF336 family)